MKVVQRGRQEEDTNKVTQSFLITGRIIYIPSTFEQEPSCRTQPSLRSSAAVKSALGPVYVSTPSRDVDDLAPTIQ